MNIEEQISDFVYNTRITSDNASDEQKLRKFIQSLLDQQKADIGKQFVDWYMGTENELVEDAILRITGVKVYEKSK